MKPRFPSAKNSDMSQSDEQELDFLSELFDPLLALKSSNIRLPDPRAKPLDNLYRCRQLLPRDHPEALTFQTPGPKKHPHSELAKSRTSYVELKKQRAEVRRNPLREMMDSITSGPLLLLKKLCVEKAPVRVVTRHAKGVRGSCTGTLIVFDKYMNMVLRDVEEDYTVLLRLGREDAGGGKLKRARHRQERRHRTLKQVFLRGDSVVCVQHRPESR